MQAVVVEEEHYSVEALEMNFFFFGRNYFRKQCNVKKTPSRVAWAVEVFIKISLTFSNYYLMAFG